MVTNNLKSTADYTVRRREMVRDGQRVLVGLSGGADSVALTHYLTASLGRESVVAMHVNHMIRGESADRDERFCRDFAAALGIEFLSVRVDVPAAAGGSSLEETARDMRYAALEAEAEKRGIAVIALAHNANDNAETTLFNIARGCGISGLGIPPVRKWRAGIIVRPLIEVPRKEIEAYLAENRLTHITDETNADTEYTRNYIRHAVLPSLDKINSAAVANISRLSACAADDEAFIASLADRAIAEAGGHLTVKLLASMPYAVQKRAIRKAISAVIYEAPSEKATEAVISLISAGKNGTVCELPCGARAIIADGELFILNKEKFDALSDMSACRITAEKPPDTDGLRVYRAKIKAGLIAELYMRKRSDGDAYFFGGMTRTLKKLKGDIPCDARSRRPVICDKNGIVWYPGFRVRDDAYDAGAAEIYYTEPIILNPYHS